MNHFSRSALAPPPGSRFARDPARSARRWPLEDRGRRLVWRGPYERDRDRVVHSRAFRRLGEKSQLLPAGLGLQVRTRLTHTLEVASAARSLARALGLNEDLTDVIALAHDLGQPPFGAAGGRAIDRFLTQKDPRRGGPEDAADAAGFSPRAQALRVVELLEVRYDHPGLNLTDDVREGLLKLDRDDAPVPAGVDPAGLNSGAPAPLEAQAVRAAVSAVTPLHDLEDALVQGLLELADVVRVPGVRALIARLEKAGAWPRGKFRRHAALHRALVHAVMSDILVASRRRLARVEATGDIPANKVIVAAGPRGADLAGRLRELIVARVVGRPAIRRADARAERLVEETLSAWRRDPRLLDDVVLLRYKEVAGRPFLRDVPRSAQDKEIAEHYQGRPAFLRVLADHVAGMTDHYARTVWEALVPGRSAV